MKKKTILKETELAGLAKEFRKKAGISKSEAARQLGVIKGTVHQAEDYPDASLTKLRIKMIEKYSDFKVVGPVYYLESKDALAAE